MHWNNNQLLDDENNVLAIVQWDNESNSWEYINQLDDTGVYGYDREAEAMTDAETSVKATLSDMMEDDRECNPPDSIASLGLYGMF